jgi:hypothetical protein
MTTCSFPGSPASGASYGPLLSANNTPPPTRRTAAIPAAIAGAFEYRPGLAHVLSGVRLRQAMHVVDVGAGMGLSALEARQREASAGRLRLHRAAFVVEDLAVGETAVRIDRGVDAQEPPGTWSDCGTATPCPGGSTHPRTHVTNVRGQHS